VAAGPAKVGENSPRLDDVTWLVVLVAGAAAFTVETDIKPATIITGTAMLSSKPRENALYIFLSLGLSRETNVWGPC
jgi:hypothetical protein